MKQHSATYFEVDNSFAYDLLIKNTIARSLWHFGKNDVISVGAESDPSLAIVLKTGGICVSHKGLASELPMDAPVSHLYKLLMYELLTVTPQNW